MTSPLHLGWLKMVETLKQSNNLSDNYYSYITMKIYNKYIVLAAMALTFAACTQEDDFTPQTDSDAVKINATIGKLQTRVAYEDDGATNFINGDKICVQNTLRDTKNIATYTFDGTTWTTTDALVWNGGTAESQFQAWYPATASFDKFTLPTDQNSREDLSVADWMTASTSAMVKPDDKTINLAFEHKLAKITVQVTEFTSQFGDDPYLTAATIYSLYDEYVTVNGGIKPVLGGNAATAIVCPGRYAVDENLMEVTITDDRHQTNLNVPVNAFLTDTGLEAGKHYTFSLKVGKDAISITKVNVEPWTTKEIDGGVAEEVLLASTETELIAALENGGNIMLTGDITVSDEYWGGYKITKNTTIDLNGHTITGVHVFTPNPENAGVVLTISGNGTIKATDPDSDMPVDVWGTLNLLSGTIEGSTNIFGTINMYGGWVDELNTDKLNSDDDTSHITGGYVRHLNCWGGIVTISGGHVEALGIKYGRIIISGGTFGFDPTAYLAEGYTATENEGIWTVAPSNN